MCGQAKMGNDTVNAHRLKAGAAIKRQVAVELGPIDPTGARWNRLEAADMEKAADTILTLSEHHVEGTGGELALPSDRTKLPGHLHAVENPDMVSLQASHERVGLIDNAGAFNLGFDAAKSIKARDSFEKMLAHQLAAAHKHCLDLLAESGRQRNPVERARLANTSARLMAAFQSGLVTLGRYRSGGKQTVIVQHVQVADGAQAVITGTGDVGGRKAENAR